MIASLYPPFRKWSEVGTIWIYSDPHFGDEEIKRLRKNYIGDEEQIARINSKVGKRDTLIILGDIGDESLCKKLRGYKVLVMGNHDKGATKYGDYFDEIYEGPVIISEKLLLSHEPVSLPFVFNIHGHDHAGSHKGNNLLNVCAEQIDYTPVNLTRLLKSGLTSKVETIHRLTIDDATIRKSRRNAKHGK